MTVENAIAIAGGFTPRACEGPRHGHPQGERRTRARHPAAAGSAAPRRHRHRRRALVLTYPSPWPRRIARRCAPGRGVRARRFVSSALLLVSSAASSLTCRRAAAEKFPNRPIKFVVGFLAGGPNDIVARIFCDWLHAASRPALRGREQGRAGRHDRGEVGDRFAAGRLHLHVRRAEQRHRPDAVQEPAVQSRARHHADRRHHAAHQHHGGAAVAAGEDRRRLHRLRQGQSGQVHASPRPATARRSTCRASCSR